MIRPTNLLLGLTAAAGLAIFPACDTFQGGAKSTGESVGFSMQPSTNTILEGETVTLTTSSANTLGRNAEIIWHAEGGEVRTSENGRVAQVTFPRNGTYTVSADLMLDGTRAQTQSSTIEVRALKVPGAEPRPTTTEEREAQRGATGYGELQLQRAEEAQRDAQQPDAAD